MCAVCLPPLKPCLVQPCLIQPLRCSLHGAARIHSQALGPPALDACEIAQHHGHVKVAAWLERSRDWTSALHHLELLTPEETLALLRAGADIHASVRSGSDNAMTPLKLAQAMLSTSADGAAGCAAAATVVQAAMPWRPASHHTFPLPARAQACELIRLGYKLSRSLEHSYRAQALLDVWVEYVMPLLIER